MRRRLGLLLAVLLALVAAWWLLRAPVEAPRPVATTPHAPPPDRFVRTRTPPLPPPPPQVLPPPPPPATDDLPYVVVRCDLVRPVDVEGEVSAIPLSLAPSGIPRRAAWVGSHAPASLTGQLTADAVALPVAREGWTQVALEVPGHVVQGQVLATAAGCVEPVDLQPAATITGRVVGPVLDGALAVRVCGRSATVDTEGTFLVEVPAGEPCTAQALRYDGPFEALGDVHTFAPEAGDTVDLVLDVPQDRAAGLGAQIEGTDEGVVVRRLRTDGDAWDAGLRPGDLLLDVDGTPLPPDPLDVVDWLVGPEGTPVSLTVRGVDGVERTLEIDRTAFDDGMDPAPGCQEGERCRRVVRPGLWAE
ncbi:MAG: hypothetical protein H6732_19315 [Alphaproteobacteria bacterium]|nr:hypothetical protein [Alphaproteobacteria bacterium]